MQPTRRQRPEGGFTLLEIIVSLAVLGIIMVPLTMAFSSAFLQSGEVQRTTGASADAQRIASWWAKDVHNVEASGYTPQSGACGPVPGTAPTVEFALATFQWDTSTTTVSGTAQVVPKTASWVVEGIGPDATLVRRYCEKGSPISASGAPLSEAFIADSFWKRPYEAQKLIHGKGGYGTYNFCDIYECTIGVTGNFKYELTVARRVVGDPPPVASTPPAPTITGVLPGRDSLTPAWLPSVVPPGVAPVDQYKVVVTSSPGGALVGSPVVVGGDQLAAVVTGLTIGTQYWVQVQAHNTNGWGPLSDPYGGVSPIPVAPGPPENVTAVRGDGQLTVGWDPPSDDGGAGITDWKVYARVAATQELVSVSEFPGASLRSAVVGPLANGTELSITVSAINSAGEGPESLPAAPVRPCGLPDAPPEAPTVNDVGNEQVRVIYQSPLEDNGCGITNYRIYSDPLVAGSPWTTTDAANEYTTPGLGAGSFTFRVAAINEAGEGPLSPPSAAVDPDNVPLQAPINAQWEPKWFNVGQGGNPDNIGGRLSWIPLPNLPEYNGGFTITGYQVTISPVDPGNSGNVPGCPGCFFVDGANSEAFEIGNMIQALGTYPNESYKEYTVTVAAVNDNGAGPKATLTVRPGGRPHASPANVQAVPMSATASTAAVRITWDQIADDITTNGGRTITGYQVQWTPNAQDNSNRIDVNNITTTQAAIGNLVPGEPYTFKVAARNASGASIPSTTLTIYAPSQLSAIPGSSVTLSRPSGTLGNRLNLTFPPFTTNPGNPTPTYTARCFASGEADVNFTGLSAGTNLISSPSLTNGKLWNCQVTGTVQWSNGSFTRSSTSTVGATPYAAPNAPGTPNVTALSGGLARINWSAPSSDGGSAITGYTITSSPAAAGFPVTVGAGTLTYDTPSPLTFGTSYTFTVVANNAAGSSPGASSAAYTPSSSLPLAAPTGLTWTPVNANQIKLTWTPVPNSAPQNGGLPLTKQVITLSPAPTSGSATVDLGVGASEYTYTTNQLSSGAIVNYTATVYAVNPNGNGPSASTSAKAGGAPLAAVTNVSSSPFNPNNTIRLNWTPTGDTAQDNGGKSIDGYNIRWSTGGGPYSAPYFVGGVGSSTTALGGLTAGQAYTFRITANNQGGAVAGDSAVSATFVTVIPGPPVIAGSATLSKPGNPANTGKLVLTFGAWTVPGGVPPINGYTASCTSSDGGAPIGPIAVQPSPTSTELTVTAGKTYTCSITATNTFTETGTTGTTIRTGVGPQTAY